MNNNEIKITKESYERFKELLQESKNPHLSNYWIQDLIIKSVEVLLNMPGTYGLALHDKEPEQWVPKVGDLFYTDEDLSSPYRVIKKRKSYAVYRVLDFVLLDYYYDSLKDIVKDLKPRRVEEQ